jgi:hypothetical protein
VRQSAAHLADALRRVPIEGSYRDAPLKQPRSIASQGASVESRMGAVTWAMRQRPVSHHRVAGGGHPVGRSTGQLTGVEGKGDRSRWSSDTYNSSSKLSAEAVAEATRGDWLIENNLHWTGQVQVNGESDPESAAHIPDPTGRVCGRCPGTRSDALLSDCRRAVGGLSMKNQDRLTAFNARRGTLCRIYFIPDLF